MSSLLEVFGVMFESDSSDLNDDLDKTQRSIDDTERSLNDILSSIDGFTEGMNGMSADAEKAALSLTSFSKEEVEFGSTLKGIRDLQEAFSELSQQDAIEIGEKLGFDSRTIASLQQGEEGIEDIIKQMSELEEQSEDTQQSFLDFIESSKEAIASVVALGGVTAAAINTAQMTDEVGKFSETLGLNIEDVSAWSEAVVRSGGDANGFRSSIEGLTRGITDFAITGGGAAAETFARLGIAMTDAEGNARSAFEVLPDLADAFADMDAAQSAGFGERLGLDQGTILLLQQGRREVEALVEQQRALGVATQEDYEIAERFNDTWSDTKQVFNALSITAGGTILPLLTDILEGVQDVAIFAADNEALVSGFFIGLAGVLATFYYPAVVTAATATWALISPFLAVAAAAIAVGAAIALIVDDIYAFTQGNESLIGSIFKNYPNIERLVMKIVEVFKALAGVAMDVGSALVEFLGPVAVKAIDGIIFVIDGLLTALNAVVGAAFKVGEGISSAFTGALDIINQMREAFTNFINMVFDMLPDVGAAFDKVGGWFGFGDDEETKQIEQNINIANRTFDNIGLNPLNGQTPTSLMASTQNNRNTSVQVGNVNVQTQATDAQGMASAASGALSTEMQTALNNIDDGVRN